MLWAFLALAAVGTGVGIWSAVDSHKHQEETIELQREQIDNQYKSDYQAALDSLSNYTNNIEQSEITLRETESQLSSYENLLSRWQDNYNLTMQQTEASAYSTYKDLIDNWSGLEALNAQKGLSGRTALARESQANKELRMYVGQDMRLNSASEMLKEGFDFQQNGGILGMAWQQQHLDLLSDKASYQGQIDILKESIQTTKDSISTSLAGLGEGLNRASELADKAGVKDKTTIDQIKKQYGDRL